MLATKYSFYRDCLVRWIGDRSARVLVVGAGIMDAGVFREAGFQNVLLTDVDARVFPAAEKASYPVESADVEALRFPDESFDYVVAHAMLHHCRSPHRALLEMYRVARRGIIAIEARDSALMRMAERLHLTNTYEVEGLIRHHGGKSGGVANTGVPNFVYRFTERELVKLLSTWRPEARHQFDFDYATFGGQLLTWRNSTLPKRLMGKCIELGMSCFTTVFRNQQNLFAMHVRKPVLPADLQPWMKLVDGQPEVDMTFRGWA